MAIHHQDLDNELPDLQTIILPRHKLETAYQKPLRRSPRKNAATTFEQSWSQLDASLTLSATSNQRRVSPAKLSPSKRQSSKAIPQSVTKTSIFDEAPVLLRRPLTSIRNIAANTGRTSNPTLLLRDSTEADALHLSLSNLKVNDNTLEPQNELSKQRKDKHKAVGSITQRAALAAYTIAEKVPRSRKHHEERRGNRFVLDEARCDEDLVDSDEQDQDEDEETDLSGFIVDDDAEISYHESSEEKDVDSEEERRTRRKLQKEKPRRRLQRGRKRIEESEGEVVDSDDIVNAIDKLQIDDNQGEHFQHRRREVIDLTSPEPKSLESEEPYHDHPSNSTLKGTNLFDKFKALRLSPPRSSQLTEIPSKAPPTMLSPSATDGAPTRRQDRFTTPPTTPPRSPTKLKSPSKLLSPSKRGVVAPRSPHRQSMDAFWDLNEINEWNDQFSPKKAPITSPRKNRLAAFDLWSDAQEDSFEAVNESSDSLPSPCESPSKSKSRSASPVKAEKQRLLAEKRAKQAEKKTFEENREQMAEQLLHALDKNVTGSHISKLAASTGGVQIVWSKTLRSTAGRANWRRTVTKPTGSPVKGKVEESAPGMVVQHFANIELAIKVIDRPDRLINTLAHEFCHLTNFMISGIRDQPHGASFQNWARKVTAWMKSQDEMPEWKSVEVTTKHGYVIEWKYLWICVGRDQNKAMEFLNISDDDGCGAEYGRHSKSIDTDKHRCGRCKGKLIQVRPKPRASPVKKTERKQQARSQNSGAGVKDLEKLVEIVELSD